VEPGQVCGGAQFERSGILTLRNRQRLFKELFASVDTSGPSSMTSARAFRRRNSASNIRSLVCPAVAKPLLIISRAGISWCFASIACDSRAYSAVMKN